MIILRKWEAFCVERGNEEDFRRVRCKYGESFLTKMTDGAGGGVGQNVE